MRNVTILLLFVASLSLNAQVQLSKDYVNVMFQNQEKEYVVAAKNKENTAISLKRTNTGFRIALQRNGIAQNFTFWIKKENVKIKENEIVLTTDDSNKIVIGEQMCFYLNQHGMSFDLTNYEKKRLRKVLSRNKV